ncbi:Sodium-independent sulfate anion transporter [Amphibalanus amphitrite]|uniref:Sodium-independent sulfate anion transporter n=1 Tax=Amphibalanus amphitrite TaxID=1232801 RepID=A0A6A4WA51_AMPAM|nr:Sodium-independent sulfate anion transporter [Amphibalanus amphitrite]
MSVQKWIKSVGARCARGASIGRRLPIVSWLPAYSASLLIRDLLAGVTVALMAVPQGIAYGQLAGLPPHFGLYACLLTGIWYAALGTTDVVSVGPTAVMSLLTAEFTGGDQQRAVLLAFFTGAVVTAAGCLRLGFLVDFFSVPVVSGFVSAASITICTTQLKGLFGLKLPPFHGSSRNTTSPDITSSAGNASVVADPARWPGVTALASELGLGLMVVPLVATIECMAIAKAFAAHNRPQDHSQEMIALGVCNLLGALFSSYTVTGSFSRTALNHASGAATPIAGVITCE